MAWHQVAAVSAIHTGHWKKRDCYMPTRVSVDVALLRELMRLTGSTDPREAVESALKELILECKQRAEKEPGLHALKPSAERCKPE